jgi:GNAT superfamily N-acetyltransferase
VIIRVIPGDEARIREFFSALSVRTRFQRFFAAITPTPAMLRILSGGRPDTEALIAIQAGVIIGHAVAAHRPGQDGSSQAEIGVVVSDAWQGRGVGAALVAALATAARERGAGILSMDIQASNRPALDMIFRQWPQARSTRGRDGVSIQVSLAPQDQGPKAPALAAGA